MSLSNISKDHVNNLFLSLCSNNPNPNSLENVKRNHMCYGQLKLIAKQIQSLKNEALQIIEESNIQDELQSINPSFRLVSGTFYYLYEKKTVSMSGEELCKKYFSLISPIQWNNKDRFLGKYFYDFDKNFVKEEE